MVHVNDALNKMDTYNSSNKNHSDSNKLFSRTKMSARSQGADLDNDVYPLQMHRSRLIARSPPVKTSMCAGVLLLVGKLQSFYIADSTFIN